ncbi:MAG: apolipoprotein N-acyltransferase, partial [Pseudomonadota bacterium]
PTAMAAARIGWLFGVGYFLPGLLWIGEAFLVEAERFAWMRPFAVTLLPMGLALFWGAAFWGAARLSGGPAGRALALAGLFAVAEYARSTLFTGFPWGLLAYAWVNTPLAQGAAWLGPFGLSFATIFAALAPYFALLAAKGAGPRVVALAGALAGVLFVFGLWSAGASRLDTARLELTDVMVRLVQPNVPQREKWEPRFVERNLETLLSLSGGAGDGAPIRLVVWPEAATPYPIATDDALRQAVMARMPRGARLAYGALRLERTADGGRRVYNSLFLVGAGPEARIEGLYDKHHLVPFGEYVPFESVLEPLGLLSLAGGRAGFSAGPGPRTLSAEGLPTFQPLICYEAIFPSERPPLEERPEWLLQSTNDAWFGESSGPWQHLAQAQFRAIEQGLPLYRSANTGVSAGLDPYGRVMAELALGRRGIVDVPLVKPLPPTPYLRHGEAPWMTLALLAVLGAVALRSHERGR